MEEHVENRKVISFAIAPIPNTFAVKVNFKHLQKRIDLDEKKFQFIYEMKLEKNKMQLSR